jgi:hypothetical protein
MGRRLIEAFVAADAAATAALLAADATFHSPVADYEGREQFAAVLAALVQVVTGITVTSVLERPGETAAFFTAAVNGRQVDGMVRVIATSEAPATELTIILRPLEYLLAAVERLKQLLDSIR